MCTDLGLYNISVNSFALLLRWDESATNTEGKPTLTHFITHNHTQLTH